jgi:capsular exopolysaccharide synthesis family protein
MGRTYEAIMRAEQEIKNSAKGKKQDIDKDFMPLADADLKIQAVKCHTHKMTSAAEIVSQKLYMTMTTLNDKSDNELISVVFSGVKSKAGASTISINTAKAFCKNSNSKVLLIDGNLRTPALHYYFGIKNADGLTDIVNGKIASKEALYGENKDVFYFIPSGTKVDNPMTFFLSEAFSKFHNELKKYFSFIIYDSGPILTSPETAFLAKKACGLVLIVEAGVTKWEVAKVAKKQLEDNNVNILGAILNKKKYYIPSFFYNKI